VGLALPIAEDGIVTDPVDQISTSADLNAAELAARPDASRPPNVAPQEWRKHRMAAGQMVIVRSHFKSIYLIPMAAISFICGIWMVFGASGAQIQANELETAYRIGLVWTVAFVVYMNMFIFEWSRTWTYILLSSIVAVLAIGFAVNDPAKFPVWKKIGSFFASTKFTSTAASYFFFGIYFGLCAFVSWLKTRLNYVVVEHNELQFHKNALFGDRERVSLLNPRIEVRITDMLEYFHPFYRSGQIIIHAPDRTIVLDNVLQIRAIERVLDRLTGTLSVKVDTSKE
jgi:hypothetical protein